MSNINCVLVFPKGRQYPVNIKLETLYWAIINQSYHSYSNTKVLIDYIDSDLIYLKLKDFNFRIVYDNPSLNYNQEYVYIENGRCIRRRGLAQ